MSELDQLADQYLDLATSTDEAVFFAALSEAIAHLIQHDFAKLLSIIYRIDVREDAFRVALEGNGPGTVADNLAALVMDKLKQKRYWRLRYRAAPEENSPNLG